MFLVLVNTSGGKEILISLEKAGIGTIAMLPSVYDAGLFGIGNAVTGRITEKRILNILSEYDIAAVIDALNDNESEASFAISRICKEHGLRLLKYISEADYSEYWNLRLIDDAVKAADILNGDSERTLMFGSAEKIRDIAEWVLDKRKLYTAVLKGSEMDIDFSLSSCIPLANIIASNSMEGAADISSLAKRYQITRFVCYENMSVLNKLDIAKSIDAEVIMIKKQRPDYYTPFDTVEQIIEEAILIEDEFKQKEKEKLLKNSDEHNNTEEQQNSSNSVISNENTENAVQKSADEQNEELHTNSENNANSSSVIDTAEPYYDSLPAVSEDEINELLSVSEDSSISDSSNSEDELNENTQTNPKTKIAEGSDISETDTENTLSVSKDKVVNSDGTVNMSEFVKYVKEKLDIGDPE